MARERTTYICQQCGASYHRWQGWCHACGGSNTIQEEVQKASEPGGLKAGAGKKIAFGSLQDEGFDAPRMKTGIEELDRVCGGGLVPASGILVGGDPGIGKSTLLLQAAAKLASAGLDCVYISGEEAAAQVGLRARRLGLTDAPVRLAAANSLRDILTSLEADTPPAVVIIDSIQTMFADTLDSAPGTVSQVRTCAQELIRFAKRRGSCVLLVGHVTKDGQIAGPRVLEHMVDTVLYFEGERGHQFRILRAVKNRFGPTDEIGVFEMTDGGLNEVRNPSALFLGDRGKPISGTAVFRRHRRDAAPAGRDPGAGRRLAARHAAADGGRLGFGPPRHGSGRARRALRPQHGRQRRLPERGGRPPRRRTGRRSGRRCGLGFVPVRPARSGQYRDFRRNWPVGRSP